MINKIFEASAKKMLIDFESIKPIDNPGVKGSLRETSLARLLGEYLPKRYEVCSGIIIDASGKQSLQQDLMIYDIFSTPILVNSESEKILFPESVLSVIEVKSVLKTSDIGDMVKKSFSVWNLEHFSKPGVILSSLTGIDPIQVKTLCMGFAYQSDVKLSEIPKYIRQHQSEKQSGIALSLICVLSDPNEESGLILNVDPANLTRICPEPFIDSRLAVVKGNSKGDTLLLLYLILSEHLRLSSLGMTYPDLDEYARRGGLMKEGRMTIARSEIEGASISINNSTYNLDTLTRLRELNQKLFKYHNITDDEIIEFFYLLPLTPVGIEMLNRNSRFIADGKILDVKTPIEFYEAVTRFQSKELKVGDRELLAQLISIIRSVGKDYRRLMIGYMRNRNHEEGGS